MLEFHEARKSEARLRVIFADDQVSLGLPAGATLGDVAYWVAALANLHDSAVVSIKLTAPMRRSSIDSTGVFHGTH